MTVEQLNEAYHEEFKSDLKSWKAEFVSIESFLKYSCSADICNEKIVLREAQKSSSTLQYLSRPQFSQFYGFTEGEKSVKGVAYRVWRFEVSSAMSEGLYSNDIISEHIRKSLQGEAKNKIVGFEPGVSPECILTQLDKFYGDGGALVGDELLSKAYGLRQKETEEVSAFASRLDNQIRRAKVLGAELLPDEDALDRHLRLIFWEGLKGNIKDKARHKKDHCKTFAELIEAARYGEKEALPTQVPRRLARSNQMSGTNSEDSPFVQTSQGDPSDNPATQASGGNGPPAWLSHMCTTLAKELKGVMTEEKNSKGTQYSRGSDQQLEDQFGERNSRQSYNIPTCYRCGQVGHIRKGCRNTPSSTGTPDSGNGMMPSTRASRRQ